MLFIKFKIDDSSKYTDFKKLYNHMVDVRQPGFLFEEEELLTFDWESMNEQDVEDALKKINAYDNPEIFVAKRYKSLIPDYANTFLEKYIKTDNDRLGALGIQNVLSLLSYLEHDFEVDMDNLETLNNDLAIVEFSTGNFPFGGMERFLIILKAFGLISIEGFDGFSIVAYNWTTDFEYSSINLPEETKVYLKELKR